MTHKQYEASQIIMQMSRIFADQMRKCLENAGLLDEGYQLNVHVGQPVGTVDKALNYVWLDKDSNVRKDDYMKDKVWHYCFEGKGWVVVDDPVVKSGTVPPVVRIHAEEGRGEEDCETARKPLPPDGLWISCRDDYYPVDGGQ